MEERKYVPFTEEMKKDYTILIPNMLPNHFSMIATMLNRQGYNMELLTAHGPNIAELGLSYVHNDTCYPAILVIGQFMDALQSGKYDPHKVALIYFQTGGGCRASNYIFLIRKALKNAGMEYIPVISLSFNGLEDHPGFNPGPFTIIKMFYGVIYGDLIMSLKNQVEPYEINKGETQKLGITLCKSLGDDLAEHGISFARVKKNCRKIIEEYGKIEVKKEEKVRVGVVGEIYVKFSSLGNNGLEKFLLSEGAEPVVPGLFDFLIYTVYAKIDDYKRFGLYKKQNGVFKMIYKFLLWKQKQINKIVMKDGRFRPAGNFKTTMANIQAFMNTGVKMGEGWLLPAEMLELYDSGTKNIICAQPFGCLPNHIVGKGMMKPLKDKFPDMNIVAVDYDAGATKVNQENRIKLMLSNARDNLEAEKTKANAANNGVKG